MKTVEIFDREVCCKDGICSGEIRPELLLFHAQLGWIREQGVEVHRYFRSENALLYSENASVKRLVEEHGEKVLPIISVNGNVLHSGGYPTNDQLRALFPSSEHRLEPKVEAVACIAAAVAAESASCTAIQISNGVKAGIHASEVAQAIEIGLFIAGARACGCE